MRIRRLLGCAILAVATLLAAFGTAGSAAQKLVVMVLYFDNNSGRSEFDVLSKGLADMLITDLSGAEELQIVEREKLESLLAELKLQQSKFFDPATAAKMGRVVGAKYAVTGAFASFTPELRIDIRLIEVATGNVVLTDKVVGSAERFLDLEQKLASKFIAGLRVKFAPPASSAVADVGPWVTYGAGLDAVDRGDLQAASRKLAEVVRSAPDWTRVGTKYAEILQRISEAAAKRNSGISDVEVALLQSAQAGLQADLLSPNPSINGRHLGARLLLVMLAKARIWRLQKAALHVAGYAVVPRAQWNELFSAMKDYLTASQELQREFEACKKANPEEGECAGYGRIANEDYARVRVLMDEHFDERLPVGPRARAELAHFLILGLTHHIRVRPTLGLVDPRYAELSAKLFEDALAEVAGAKADDWRDVTASLLDSYAQALLAQGKKMPAIAQWQRILDEFPTYRYFPDIKQKMEKVLGATPDMQNTRPVLASCTLSTLGQNLAHVRDAYTESILPAEGARGASRWVDSLVQACAKLPYQHFFGALYSQAAQAALLRGDCPLHDELTAKAVQLAPAFVTEARSRSNCCK